MTDFKEEPTVLDYVKSLLDPRARRRLAIPAAPAEEGVEPEPETRTEAAPVSIPWRGLMALGLALIAQGALEPEGGRSGLMGAALYLLAAGLLVWANLRQGWQVASPPPDEPGSDPVQGEGSGALLPSVRSGSLSPLEALRRLRVRPEALLFTALLIPLTYLAFGSYRFNVLNLTLWGLALYFCVRAFWTDNVDVRAWLRRQYERLRGGGWNLSVNPWTLLVLVVFGMALFFRFYRLAEVPPQMVSDHAEKLLDVWDVLHGQLNVFFPRNTGRELDQMYLTAAVIKLFDTGYTFLSLKIGTALASTLTLIYLYLLGKEVGSRRVGLLAVAFAGVSYWLNTITRIGLRFPLYAAFWAPTFYHMLRGLRTSSRRDFALAGLFLGLGLHGYSPYRIVPLVVVIAFLLYALHQREPGKRRMALFGLAVIALVSLVVFLPLLRYAVDNPDMFSYRTLTRVSDLERPLPGPAGLIFLDNLWNALTMFAWDNGEVWVYSIPGRPALGVVSGALFHLGAVLVLVRYVRRRHWLDLFLLLSIPLLMLPSILSLAFPNENPALNRTSAALVPVFLVVGIALDGLLSAVQSQLGSPSGGRAAWALAVLLFGWSAMQNYGIVFNQYQRQYELSSWNTSEMGEVIASFTRAVGRPEAAWVAAYPHWADTRLVMFNAGYPTGDAAIWPDSYADTLNVPGAKLFLIKPEDTEDLTLLQDLYPQGVAAMYDSQVETKDFLMFFVPPSE